MKGEWERIKLGDVCKLQGGFAFGSTDFKESGIPLIRISNITNKGIAGDPVFIDERKANQHSEFLLNENDILIAMSGATTGKNCQIKLKNLPAILNQRTGRFQIFNTNKLSNDFLAFIVGFKNFQEKLLVDAIGGAQPNVSSRQIESVVFELPPLSQQRKIARILSTCDAVIEKTEAAIAKYGALKQGLMHDLFTRGIDIGTGKLRPPREEAPELYKKTELGWVPKEWEVKRLDALVENLDGRRIPIKKEDREKMSGNIPYYGASGIIDYVNDFIFDEPLILLGEDGENVISRNLPLAFKITGKSWVNNHAHVLRPFNRDQIDFFTFYLESLDYSNLISGSAQPKINQANLNKKLLSIPPDNERVLISEFVKTIENKVQTEKFTLSKYRELKAGLMQDLLTGKVEVEVEKETVKN